MLSPELEAIIPKFARAMLAEIGREKALEIAAFFRETATGGKSLLIPIAWELGELTTKQAIEKLLALQAETQSGLS